MDDEVEYTLKPYRHDRLSVLGVGLHFVSNACDALGSAFGALAMMTIQTQMQHDVDKKFEQVIRHGG
jgi:hypothetical protein